MLFVNTGSAIYEPPKQSWRAEAERGGENHPSSYSAPMLHKWSERELILNRSLQKLIVEIQALYYSKVPTNALF